MRKLQVSLLVLLIHVTTFTESTKYRFPLREVVKGRYHFTNQEIHWRAVGCMAFCHNHPFKSSKIQIDPSLFDKSLLPKRVEDHPQINFKRFPRAFKFDDLQASSRRLNVSSKRMRFEEPRFEEMKSKETKSELMESMLTKSGLTDSELTKSGLSESELTKSEEIILDRQKKNLASLERYLKKNYYPKFDKLPLKLREKVTPVVEALKQRAITEIKGLGHSLSNINEKPLDSKDIMCKLSAGMSIIYEALNSGLKRLLEQASKIAKFWERIEEAGNLLNDDILRYINVDAKCFKSCRAVTQGELRTCVLQVTGGGYWGDRGKRTMNAFEGHYHTGPIYELKKNEHARIEKCIIGLNKKLPKDEVKYQNEYTVSLLKTSSLFNDFYGPVFTSLIKSFDENLSSFKKWWKDYYCENQGRFLMVFRSRSTRKMKSRKIWGKSSRISSYRQLLT